MAIGAVLGSGRHLKIFLPKKIFQISQNSTLNTRMYRASLFLILRLKLDSFVFARFFYFRTKGSGSLESQNSRLELPLLVPIPIPFRVSGTLLSTADKRCVLTVRDPNCLRAFEKYLKLDKFRVFIRSWQTVCYLFT
jgi:hypothetical protein